MKKNLPIRIGHGYDLHQLKKGRKLIIGGVVIPFPFGLLGHSDADCLTHALADAILGALALPDIGHFFPDTDKKNEGIDSKIILKYAVKKAEENSYEIGNIDLTLIAEQPKFAPHINKIKNSLATTMNMASDQIGLKVTTNEKIGAIGRKEGIAAFAVCTLFLNES